MTENERKAIDTLKDMISEGQYNGADIVARDDEEELKTAIQALEEIQQYRAIGTVEELKEAKVIYNEILLSEGKLNLPKKCIAYEVGKLREKELREYKAIGTIEEFKDLKEKAEAKKPILNNPKINEFYVKEAKLCPSCHSYINDCSGDYCRDCGQRIDFGKEE